MREERVLLRLVKAVNFIDKEDCLPPVVLLLPSRVDNDLPNLLNTRQNCTKVDKVAFRGTCHNTGEGGLSGSGGTPEYHRIDLPSLDRFSEDLPLPEQMLLPDEVAKRLGSNTFRQRDLFGRLATGLIIEKTFFTLL